MFTHYAPVYDRIGQGAWSVRMAAWTLDWLAAHGIEATRAADFGCGTGAAARVLAASGMHVTAIDCSPAMLRLGRQHANPSIEWVEGDICEIVLPEQVDLVVSLYDTLNYLLTLDDLQRTWQRIADALRPGGYAVADVNTVAAYGREWDGRNTTVADTDDIFVLNRLTWEPLVRIGIGRILWFVRDGDSWVQGEEIHRQRGHTDREITEAIVGAGLRLVTRATPVGDEVTETSPRMIYVAQKETAQR